MYGSFANGVMLLLLLLLMFYLKLSSNHMTEYTEDPKVIHLNRLSDIPQQQAQTWLKILLKDNFSIAYKHNCLTDIKWTHVKDIF